MGLLEHLVGFPIPTTPAYQIAGRLDLQGFDKIRVQDLQGRIGNSDIAGSVEEQPGGTEENGKSKPVVTLDLRSNRVDLTDLNGFIGGTPGRATTAVATPEQRRGSGRSARQFEAAARCADQCAEAQWADIHLHYHGAHIEGRNMPLDDVTVAVDMWVGTSRCIRSVSASARGGWSPISI